MSRSLLLGLVVAIAAAAMGFGVLGASGDTERRAGREPRAAPSSEIRLDARIPAQARRAHPEPEGARRRQNAGPSEEGGSRASEDEQVPPHILRENVKLRGELADLKALEAERGRVARALDAAGTFDGPLRLGAGGLAWPVTGPLVSPFGPRGGRLHAGIDIAAPAGRPIRAAARGRVAIDGPTGGYGNYACIQHNRRLTTCYAHMSRSLTQKGSIVDQGEVIGLVGCTGHCFGDHLHFETWVRGRPTDPMPYL